MTESDVVYMGQPPMRVDFLRSVDGVYASELIAGAFTATIDGLTLKVISREHLIANPARRSSCSGKRAQAWTRKNINHGEARTTARRLRSSSSSMANERHRLDALEHSLHLGEKFLSGVANRVI